MQRNPGEPASQVAREIKQTKPFQSKGHEAVIALFRTADVLHGYYSRFFSCHGVTEQQYNVLRILRGAGEEGLPTLAIAERMIERAPGITRMIDRLEAKGLVSRERRLADRRCVHCRITDAGLDLLARLDGPVAITDRDAVAALDDGQLGELVRLLDAVRARHTQPR